MNIRTMTQEYPNAAEQKSFDSLAEDMLRWMRKEWPDRRILLLPNHYFCFGSDDRYLMSQLQHRLDDSGVQVQNRPLTLAETMDVIRAAGLCVGMRFHSAVLMALLNGRCRVLNYTGKNTGKIAGFLQDFDPDDHFDSSRVLSLDQPDAFEPILQNALSDSLFAPPDETLEAAFGTLKTALAGT